MPTGLYIILAILIVQRLGELWIAKRNEKHLKGLGAIEVGEKHHKWFVIVHVAFFIAIIMETTVAGHVATTLNPYLLTLFIVAQIARIWCMTSLGVFWNTKIIVLPNQPLIQKGPYKYIKHPNYIIVGLELCIIPLLFGAYMTALIFPLIHIVLLGIRLPLENNA